MNKTPIGGRIIIPSDAIKCPKCGKDVFAILTLVKVSDLTPTLHGGQATAYPVGTGLLCFNCGHRISQKKDFETKTE